jgi:hypothetical protein
MTEQHHFETVFGPEGIRVYMYSGQQVPMQIEKASGTVTLKFKDGTTKQAIMSKRSPQESDHTVYFCPMHPDVTQMEPGECAACGGMKLMAQDYLFSEIDLSDVAPESMKAIVHIENINGKESEITFTETFHGTIQPGERKDDLSDRGGETVHEEHHH